MYTLLKVPGCGQPTTFRIKAKEPGFKKNDVCAATYLLLPYLWCGWCKVTRERVDQPFDSYVPMRHVAEYSLKGVAHYREIGHVGTLSDAGMEYTLVLHEVAATESSPNLQLSRDMTPGRPASGIFLTGSFTHVV
jgi:hypothetical protein